MRKLKDLNVKPCSKLLANDGAAYFILVACWQHWAHSLHTAAGISLYREISLMSLPCITAHSVHMYSLESSTSPICTNGKNKPQRDDLECGTCSLCSS